MKLTVPLLVLLACAGETSSATELTVATFNTWGSGLNDGQSIARTVAVLETLDADVFALQEVRGESPRCTAESCPPEGPGVAGELAEALGYYLFEPSGMNEALWANAILSRYPILSALPEDLGVLIDVDGHRVAVLNVHFPDYPYQPYQLANIEYGDAPMLQDEASAVEAAVQARGPAVDLLLDVAAQLPETGLIVICGDFNEPSHLDWTDRAATAGRHPMKVRFPTSVKLMNAGFADSFRNFRPDEVAFPGFTWTPLADLDDGEEHHDRIDFIYLKGASVRITSAAVAGESPATSDIVIEPWPSDHRAVLVRAQF